MDSIRDREAHPPLLDDTAMLDALMDILPDGLLVVDRDLRVAKANESLCRLLGVARDEPLGRPVARLLAPTGVDAVALCAEALEKGRGQEVGRLGVHRAEALQVTAVRVGGAGASPLFLLVYVAAAASEGWEFAGVQEPTERRFRALVEGLREHAVYLVDPLGYVVTWNAAAERIYRYRREEIVGRHFEVLYTDEEWRAGRPRQTLIAAATNGMYSDEGWRARGDGTRLWLEVVTTVLRDETGRLTGFANVTRDLTLRRRAEEALRQRELLDERERTMWQILQVATHELRNPMTAALSAMRLMAQAPAAEADYFRAIAEEELLRLERLLAGYSRMASAPTDRLPIDVEHLVRRDLRAVARMAVQSHPVSTTHRVEVACRRRPVCVDVEEDAMRQVLDNILTNASKYAPPGTPVHVTVATRRGAAFLAVRDHGVGIAPERAEAVFERFVRAPVPGQAGPPGLGLGLYVCRQIVNAHRGRIWLAGAVREGVTVYIELPLARAPRGSVSLETPRSGC